MKLLQINSTLNWGSTGRIAEEIGQAVIAQGWESYIAYGRYANNSQSHIISIKSKWETYIHVAETRLLDKHGLGSKKATTELVKRIKEISPNIIHLHNIHGYYLNYPILFDFLSTADIPVVWTLHDCWPFTGHCSYYSFVQCIRWQKGCYDCPQKNNYPSSLFIDRCSKNYIRKMNCFTSVKQLAIVAVSDWLAKELRESFFREQLIKVIHNGINVDVFTPCLITKEDMKCDKKFVILGVANKWEYRKGLDDFISLRKKLSEDYLIILIGLTEKQIKQMPNGIRGIHRTNSMKELAQYYSVSDVYVNFSVEETFGLTTCESMACGTPVIVYDVTACPELVSDDTGFVVSKGDLDSVVKILLQIKETGKTSYSQSCRKRVIQYFNKKERYAEYLQLYKELLKV